jgi:RNA polymerase subunit RPABC4/transcription elongation factor Spt4
MVSESCSIRVGFEYEGEPMKASSMKKSILSHQSNCCPGCGSESLVNFELDQFCTSCDWDSLLLDVESGAFEKRMGFQIKPEHKVSTESLVSIEDSTGQVA